MSKSDKNVLDTVILLVILGILIILISFLACVFFCIKFTTEEDWKFFKNYEDWWKASPKTRGDSEKSS